MEHGYILDKNKLSMMEWFLKQIKLNLKLEFTEKKYFLIFINYYFPINLFIIYFSIKTQSFF